MENAATTVPTKSGDLVHLFRDEPNPTPSLRLVGDVSKLFDAIAKARKSFGEVRKAHAGQVGHQTFKYSTLADLTAASTEALSDAGVATMQFISASPTLGVDRITTIVAGHGARIESYLDFKAEPNVQGYGKQTTYLRRYAYNALFVLDGVPDQDAAGNKKAPEERAMEDGQYRTIEGMFTKLGIAKEARSDLVVKLSGEDADRTSYLGAQKIIKALGAKLDAKTNAAKQGASQ